MNMVISVAGSNCSSDNKSTITIPDHTSEVFHPDRSIEASAAMVKNNPDKRSTVSATAKLLHGLRDSTSAFIPLQSVARGLCFILESCQVWPPSGTFSPQYLWSSQQTEVDEQAIELLVPRVKVLSESLCTPIHPGDINERERERKLEQ